MNHKLLIVFLFLIVPIQELLADMGPKRDNKIEFELLFEGKNNPQIDSISVITENWSRSYPSDTIYLGKTFHGRPWTWLRKFDNSKNYFIGGHLTAKTFKIIVFIEGKRYESNVIPVIRDQRFFRFNILKDGTFQDNSNLFYAHWSDYFKALILTIILELIIALAFWKSLGDNVGAFILIQFICNILTHPILWYVESHYNLSIILAELSILFIETIVPIILFRKKISVWRIIALTLLANLTSWLFGGIILYFFQAMG